MRVVKWLRVLIKYLMRWTAQTPAKRLPWDVAYNLLLVAIVCGPAASAFFLALGAIPFFSNLCCCCLAHRPLEQGLRSSLVQTPVISEKFYLFKMLGPSAVVFLALQLLNAYSTIANARPTVARSALVVRQNSGGLSQPVTVQTQDVLQT
jgi:hypothetical protein